MDTPFIELSPTYSNDSSVSSNASDSDGSSAPESAPSSTASTPPTSLSPELSTHNTVRAKYHVTDVKEFAETLETAANKALPNCKRTRYKQVQVLLLRWDEDELEVKWELDDLAKVFQNYGFKTETWLIPTEAPLRKMMGKAIEFVEKHESKDTLFIVYYGGHAYINQARRATWSCKRNPNYSSFEWGGCQGLFEQSESDTLLLLDCCSAAAAAASMPCGINSITETIAACGWETWAPAPGRHSFTNALIEVLEDWLGRRAFSAAMLHSEVLSVLKQPRPRKNREISKTPVYIVNTSNPKAHSIEIARQRCLAQPFDDLKTDLEEVTDVIAPSLDSSFTPPANHDKFDLSSLLATLPDKTFAVPHVIMSIALEGNQMLDTDSFVCWLKDFPALAKYAKIQGVYHSFSTLVLLSVPVIIWDLIPDHPAWNFVGYATSDNIIADISLETSKADWQVSRQYTFPELHTTPVSKVVDRLTESVELFKDRLDESAPVTRVLHNGTETSISPCSATKVAFPNQLARNGHLPVFPKNSWHSELPRRRNPHDVETMVKFKKTVGTDGVDLSLMSRPMDPDDDISSQREVEVEVIEDFCRGIKLKDVELGIGIAGSRKAVWFDDRGDSPDLEGSRDTRQYDNPLTPTELLQALTRNRFNDNDFPDAERRLIYITDLDPACIHTLAATASWRHKPMLINAIYNHLAFQPSIAVKLPSAAFPAFQFQVHLPFFVLRKSTPPRKYVGRVNTGPHRLWIDLSFPKLNTPESQEQEQEQDEVWGIHEAQISCAITGSDDRRWVGYGFVDADVDGCLTDLSKKDLSFDQIAARKLEVNLPIWSPREYWLRVFEIRITQVREEWDYLIKKMELSVDQYMDKNALNMPLRSGTITEKAAEIKKASDWVVQTMGLLPQLNRVLSNTIKTWRSFSSLGTNIDYFSNTDAAALSLRRIDAVFRQLQENQTKIDNLAAVSQNRAPFALVAHVTTDKVILTVNIQLGIHLARLESNKTANRTWVTSDFTILAFSSFSIVAAFFSIPQDVIRLKMTIRSFVLTYVLVIVIVYAIKFVKWQRTTLRDTILSLEGSLEESLRPVQIQSRLSYSKQQRPY